MFRKTFLKEDLKEVREPVLRKEVVTVSREDCPRQREPQLQPEAEACLVHIQRTSKDQHVWRRRSKKKSTEDAIGGISGDRMQMGPNDQEKPGRDPREDHQALTYVNRISLTALCRIV